MRLDLTGKVAVVTGGTRGIGRSVAEALAAAGASVGLLARDEEVLERAAAELRAAAPRVAVAGCDATRREELWRALDSVTGQLGPATILVNNVGASYSDRFRRAPLSELTEEELIEAYTLNTITAFNASVRLLPGMQRLSRGSVVNIASVVVTHPMREFGAYAAAKAALVSLTRSMALEWAPIRANALLVGHIDTERARSRRTAADKDWLTRHIALRRLGEPSDVAGLACFLASDLAEWITGAAFDVDGGALGG